MDLEVTNKDLKCNADRTTLPAFPQSVVSADTVSVKRLNNYN